MKSGTLFFNRSCDRMDIQFSNGDTYGGLHCGECFEVKINGRYIPTRIEKDTDWWLTNTELYGFNNIAGHKARI